MAMNTPAAHGGNDSDAWKAKQRPSRWKRLLLIGGVVVIVLLGALVALAPTLVGSYAPGIIENAAAGSIKGSVKVGKVNVGWFSDATVGPIELRDESGKMAAQLDVAAPVSLWKVVSEGWWSAKRLDLGTIQLGGRVDVERDAATGVTNLERAVAPKQQSASAPGKSSGGLEAMKAGINITKLDVLVREKRADGTYGPDAGVKDLKGVAQIEFGGPEVKLKTDLTGTPIGSGAGAFKGVIDATLTSTASKFDAKSLEKAIVKADVAGLPVAVIDAFAGMGGALTSGIGDSADVNVDATGNLKTADLKARVNSTGVQGGFAFVVRDGIIMQQGTGASGASADPTVNTLTIKSTEFLARLPAAREAMNRAGDLVKLTSAAPGLSVTIDKLRLPMPVTGNAAAASIDARGMGIEAKVRLGATEGQVALEPPAAPGQPAANWRAFRAEPLELSVSAADLAQPFTLSGSTRATLDGQPAGDVSLRAVLSGLLDSKGHIKALGDGGQLADVLDADVKIVGMSTALVQPLIAARNLPVNLPVDIGPTLDASLKALVDLSSYKRGEKDATVPPADVRVSIQSAGLQAAGAVRVEKNIMTSGPEGITATVNAIGPIARRFLERQGERAPAQIAGAGRVQLLVKDLNVNLDKLKGDQAMANLRASITGDLKGLSVKPAAFVSSAQPVDIDSASFALTLVPGSAPSVTKTGTMRYDGQTFTSNIAITFEGLKDGKIPNGGGLDLLFRMGARGQAKLDNIPRNLLGAVPAAEAFLSDRVPASDVANLVRGAIGSGASLAANFEPLAAGEGGGTSARLILTTQNQGLGGEVIARVSKASAIISAAKASFSADPNTLNPVLAQKAEPGKPALRVAQPFRIELLSEQAVTIPLTAGPDGALSPNWSAASDASLSIKADNEIVLDNVSVGTNAQGQPVSTQVRLRNFAASAKAPLSALAGTGKQGSADLTLELAKGDGKRIAAVNGKAALVFPRESPVEVQSADLRMMGIDTLAADQMLQRSGLLVGALGDKADVNLTLTPRDKQTTAIVATINAPRLTSASLSLTMDADKMVLQQPTNITWSPEASFLSSYVLGSEKPGATLKLTQVAPISIQLSRLALGVSKEESGRVISGPMKPGIFALDAVVSIPSAVASVQDGPRAQPSTLSFDSTRAAVRGGDTPGALDADLTIARISGAGGAGKPSSAKVRIVNLADQAGIVNTQNAVYNLDANLAAFPTPIVDQLGKQAGLLTEALGPTVDVVAVAQNVALGTSGATTASGRVDAKLTSQRATAELNGDIRSGTFVQTGAGGLRIIEIRPELVKQFAGGIPLVHSVEKSTKDQPAIIQSDNLTLPIDGDLRKLNGVVRVDPGVARFETQGFLSEIVQLAGIKAAGTIGNKIEPFVVQFNQGVGTYDKFRLPIGQATIESSGKVDLVNKQLDLLTYIPLGLLTDKALGLFGAGGLSLGPLDKMTMMPWRIRGSMSDPRIEPDLGKFAQETAGKVIKEPVKQIQDQLDKTIKDIFKPKPKDTPAPAPKK